MPSQYIPLEWALNIAVRQAASGIAQDELLAMSCIERKFGDERDRISHAQYVLLCMNTVVRTQDVLYGLGSKRLEVGFVPLTVRLVDGCNTLEEAIQAISRFFRLAGSTLQIGLRVDHDEAAIVIYADSTELRAAYTLERNYPGWLACCLSHFLGRRMPLTATTTRDPEHISLNQAHWSLGVRVTLDTVTSIKFPASLLTSRRGRSAGRESYWDCIRAMFESSEWNSLDRWLGKDVANGKQLRLGDFAGQAHVSSSTMRRRFNVHEGGFRQARQRALVDAAMSMLKTSDASMDSIAMDLGYADARSFRRFIKGATGKTPQELRSGDRTAPERIVSDKLVYERIRELATTIDV